MNLQKIQEIIRKDCTVHVSAKPDDIPPDGHMEQSLVEELLRKAETSEWAWAVVHVTVHWRGMSETEALGGCSYKDEEDFRCCDYFADMKEAAIENLARQAERVLFNLVLGPASPDGLEPNEVFDSVYLDNWMRERGWVHD